MNSHIEDYNILDSLVADTYACQQHTRNEVQNIDSPIYDAISEAHAERNRAEKCLEKAKEELQREEARLQQLERAARNAEKEEDKQSYNSQIAAQQNRVAHAQAKVNEIAGIISQVSSAIAILENSCHTVTTAKNNFCTNMQNATDGIGESLTLLKNNLSRASAVFQSTIKRYY